MRNVAIPRLLHVAADSLGAVGELLRLHDFDTSCVLIGSGRGPSRDFAKSVVTGCEEAGLRVVERADLAGTLEQAAELASAIISNQVTLAVAVGGGRVIDTVKLATARTTTDFVSVPTTIAHDGISSPVASLDTDGRRVSHAARMPAGIVVDTAIIAGAPPRTLRAGVGDLASNLTAILDWQLADAAGRDRYDAFCGLIAEAAARPALDLVDLSASEDHEILAKGLLMSGLAMAAAGTSRPCSGAEHLISHSLDGLLGDRASLHGEQVALGCLVSAAAHGSPLLDQYRVLFTRLGLPSGPVDIGITDDEMTRAILDAPATRPDRYTILDAQELTTDLVRQWMAAAFP